MRRLGPILVAALACACGGNPAGKTPKETVRNFEAAMRDLDMGTLYDMLSKRARGQVDLAMGNVKAALSGIPDNLLDKAGMGGLEDMEPREILVAAVKRAKKDAPDALKQLEGMTFAILKVEQYGNEATVDVSVLMNGRQQKDRVQLVRENGRWYIDSDDSIQNMPFQIAPDVAACVGPT